MVTDADRYWRKATHGGLNEWDPGSGIPESGLDPRPEGSLAVLGRIDYTALCRRDDGCHLTRL